jgi:hypothetical protein
MKVSSSKLDKFLAQGQSPCGSPSAFPQGLGDGSDNPINALRVADHVLRFNGDRRRVARIGHESHPKRPSAERRLHITFSKHGFLGQTCKQHKQTRADFLDFALMKTQGVSGLFHSRGAI